MLDRSRLLLVAAGKVGGGGTDLVGARGHAFRRTKRIGKQSGQPLGRAPVAARIAEGNGGALDGGHLVVTLGRRQLDVELPLRHRAQLLGQHHQRRDNGPVEPAQRPQQHAAKQQRGDEDHHQGQGFEQLRAAGHLGHAALDALRLRVLRGLQRAKRLVEIAHHGFGPLRVGLRGVGQRGGAISVCVELPGDEGQPGLDVGIQRQLPIRVHRLVHAAAELGHFGHGAVALLLVAAHGAMQHAIDRAADGVMHHVRLHVVVNGRGHEPLIFAGRGELDLHHRGHGGLDKEGDGKQRATGLDFGFYAHQQLHPPTGGLHKNSACAADNRLL